MGARVSWRSPTGDRCAPRFARRIAPKFEEFQVTAVTTKTDPLALVERVQALLAQTDAPLAKLEEGLLEIERVMASNDADLFEIASRRKIEMTTATPAGELDKKLDALDKRKKEIERRTEIASIVRVELETRIATDREAERAAKRQANYDDALRRHVTATNLVREFLDKFGPECRRVLCEYAESESKSAAANQDLPCGAAPISSIESERKGALRSPKTTVRKFKAYVAGMRRIAEQGSVEAAPEKDGRWGVFIPGGSTSGGNHLTCDLVDFVEVLDEWDATPWPENLAKCLSVPSFYVSERSWWNPVDDHSPAAVSDALNRLEAQPPHHFEPRIETRVMRLEAWREMNGEVVEAEPAPAAVVAE
jgi:hypothetical protein